MSQVLQILALAEGPDLILNHENFTLDSLLP